MKRFVFANYSAIRDCLNQLVNHSESMKQFPDISFVITSVIITIRPEDDGPDAPLSEVDRALAA